jgi:2'-5' RNA ligase
MPTRKLFFALFPPPAATSRIAELGQQLVRVNRLKGAMMAPDRLHCSLHRIDIAARDETWAIERARAAAARVRALPFDIAFDRTASFGSDKRHFVLFGSNGVEPLRSFRAALGSAMYYAELRDGPASAFTPHVTLLYGGDHTVEEYPVTPIRWRVDAFTLVLSVHGEGHQHLETWRLA